MDDLTAEFIEETSESLATLERALADHAHQPMTNDGWGAAAKLMHTIKGTCGFLRFVGMESVAASSEHLLAGLRDGAFAPTDTVLQQLRAAMVEIRYRMDYLAEHGAEPTTVYTPPPEPVPTVSEEAPTVSSAHTAPAHTNLLPPLPPAEQAMVATHAEAPTGERISTQTLTSLMMVRNQLRHVQRSSNAPALFSATRTIEKVIDGLRTQVLPRATAGDHFPRPAKILLIESGGLCFALEQTIIREVARIDTLQRHAIIDHGAMISLRNNVWLPRLSLAQKLGQPSAAAEAYALVIEIHGQRIALCVESVGELEEVMLHRPPRLLQSSGLYAAAAILGDGSPCLVLHAQALLQQAISPWKPSAPREVAAPEVVVASAPAASVEPIMPRPPQARALLLFSDGTLTPKAVPLADVARVEQLPGEELKQESDGFAIRCRGELLRPRLLPGSTLPAHGDFHVITLLEAPHIGIIAHRVDGIMEVQLAWPQRAAQGVVLMQAEVDGAATDIIDIRAFLPTPVIREVPHG